MTPLAKALERLRALLGRGGTQLRETVGHGRAQARVVHMRPKAWRIDEETGERVPDYRWIDSPIGPVIDPESAEIVSEEVVHNVITTVGRDFLHTQGYGTSGAANGLNYIALSNDTLSETTASTTLSTEIAANGLSRAAGTVAHTTGQNTTTVQKTFTCATASQSAQKAALFTASSSGTMNHALSFVQRTLQVGDTLQITFTITLG